MPDTKLRNCSYGFEDENRAIQDLAPVENQAEARLIDGWLTVHVAQQ
ncbi:hypothetical protein MRP04_18905 [Dickeya dianthicola]|nr:hypothetical protein [Dickeya dianthicola]MCI4032539.1 hypothetical protein [Dickeya dianthicola]MCI4172166.1 hypothetical protein [Dickeya dianthicola]MCI4181358.1 hypothetical protein [Dickeya dianthicola]MCI4202661.1 hypothetical protein [Dickeya dianthicola]MCI4221542.1 hypothetical protein [Dickeya dianthicola]